jgi:hypothetical protein
MNLIVMPFVLAMPFTIGSRPAELLVAMAHVN